MPILTVSTATSGQGRLAYRQLSNSGGAWTPQRGNNTGPCYQGGYYSSSGNVPKTNAYNGQILFNGGALATLDWNTVTVVNNISMAITFDPAGSAATSKKLFLYKPSNITPSNVTNLWGSTAIQTGAANHIVTLSTSDASNPMHGRTIEFYYPAPKTSYPGVMITPAQFNALASYFMGTKRMSFGIWEPLNGDINSTTYNNIKMSSQLYTTNYLSVSKFVIELTYNELGGNIWYNSGGTWIECVPWYNNGGTWVKTQGWYNNGGTWVKV